MRVDDVDHRRRRALRRQPERLGHRRDRLARPLGVEPHAAAEEEVGVDPAEHHVRVGHGRLGAAGAVARRPGARARAARADPEHAGLRLDPGDAAAARADRRHVDHRQRHRVLGEDRRLGVGDRAVDDHADVEARPADVGRDHAVEPEPVGERAGAEHAAGRPRGEQRDAATPRLVDREDAPRRVHHRDRALVARGVQPLAHPVEVAVHRRRQVRVEDRRRGALVLAQHRGELARGGDEPAVAEPLLELPLVLGVQERPEEGHRDRLHPLLAEPLAEPVEPLEVQRHDDGAVAVDALVDADDAGALDDRLGLREVRDVDDLRLRQAGDLLHGAADQDRILVSARRDQGRLGAGARDQQVRGDGRSVREQDRAREQLLERQVESSRSLRDRGEHALLERGRGRGRLRARDRAAVVEHDAVRERPSAVDRDDVGHGSARLTSRRSGSPGRAISISSSARQPGQ